MPNGHGGPRKPRKPAPVSGPGRLSRRTDGGPSQSTVPMQGMGYGENADFNDMQSSAPLAATGSTVSNKRTSTVANPPAAIPLFSPTQYPDEPVTAGAPFGPGPGPASGMGPGRPMTLVEILGRAAVNDPSGESAAMLALAQRMGL